MHLSYNCSPNASLWSTPSSGLLINQESRVYNDSKLVESPSRGSFCFSPPLHFPPIQLQLLVHSIWHNSIREDCNFPNQHLPNYLLYHLSYSYMTRDIFQSTLLWKLSSVLNQRNGMEWRRIEMTCHSKQ